MVRMKNTNQSILMNPNDTFSIFQPTGEKLNHIAQWLMNKDVPNVEDYERDYTYIWYNIIPKMINRPDLHYYYEMRDFGGIFGFIHIIPEHKCTLPLKIWNPKAWNSTFLRDGKELIKLIMEEHSLRRINAQSADERMVKFAEKFGFKVDGIKKNDFKFNGEYIDSYLLSMEE